MTGADPALFAEIDDERRDGRSQFRATAAQIERSPKDLQTERFQIVAEICAIAVAWRPGNNSCEKPLNPQEQEMSDT